ncbi:hypothetical protein M0R04_00940 [Candidatus Dojkabacteria bacterium]|jgi:hypothetical protein|nr:hypothetical protein [Candidatus Dojkabacteria bacterium]
MRFESVEDIPLADLTAEIIDQEGLHGIFNVAEVCYNHILIDAKDYFFSPETNLYDVPEFNSLHHEVLHIISGAADLMVAKEEISNTRTLTENLIKLQLSARLLSNKEIPDGVKNQLVNYKICSTKSLNYWLEALPYSMGVGMTNGPYNIQTGVVLELMHNLKKLISDPNQYVSRWAKVQISDFQRAFESLEKDERNNFTLDGPTTTA